MIDNATAQTQLQVQAARTILRRYRGVSILITVLTMTAVVLVSALMDPVYKATASVLIENKASSILSNVERNIDYSRDLALAQKALAISRPVLERAAEKAEIRSWSLPDPDLDPLAPLSERVINAKIEGQLLILEVLNTDPQRAVTLANAWMSAFVEEMARRQSSASAYTSGFLDNQLPALKEEWARKQTAVQNFLIETGFDRKEAEFHPVYKQYIDLNSRITQTRIQLAALKSEAAAWASCQAESDVLRQMPRARANSTLLAFEKLIQDKSRETIELRQNFDPKGDKVKRAEAALAEIESLTRAEMQRAGEQLRLEIEIEERALAEMETLLDGFRSEYLKVKSHEARYQTLAFEAQIAQSQYEELMKRQRDARVEGDAHYSYAQPWERADLPRKKYRPNWPLNVVLGTLLSVFLSASYMGVKELVNERVRTAAEIRSLGLPLAVEIPRIEGCKDDLFSLVSTAPQNASAHAVNMLRSSLAAGHLWGARSESFVVLLTSAAHGEGKSFIAANLARSFAQAASARGTKVLLVDTDLRRRALTTGLNLDQSPGLSALQSAPVALPELACALAPNLDFVPAGAAVQNSGALIESPAFANFLDRAREQYAIIILDAPPVLCGSALLKKCDATVAVVRARVTRAAELRRLSAALSPCKAVSYALNDVTSGDMEAVPAAIPSRRSAAPGGTLLESSGARA